MIDRFQVDQLPAIDKRLVEKGRCPRCLVRLADTGDCVQCPDCLDTFHSKLPHKPDADYLREERDERNRAESFFTEIKNRD